MERKPSKHARSKSGGALAAFLRSTAASFSSTTFASRPVGGGGGAKPSFNHRNAFSGPMVSIVPPEARGGGRRRAKQGGGSGYRTPEASSPKVSCIGQIKRSKSKTGRAKARKVTTTNVAPACGMDGGACPLPPRPPARNRTKRSLVKRMFCRRSMSRSSSSSSSSRRSSGAADLFKGRHGSSAAVAAAPAPGAAGLGQMKRFTSGRGAFQDFDWRDAGRRGSDVEGDDDYVDDGFVAFSAPLVLGGGVVASEPRKEVNLWRRRPMSPPTPLELP